LSQLLVSVALETEEKLLLSASSERKMGMRVYKSRESGKAFSIDKKAVGLRLDFFLESLFISRKDDLTLIRGNPSLLEETDILESFFSFRYGALTGQDLTAVGNDQVSWVHQGIFSMRPVCFFS
jgi:hypothetical protein